MLTSQDIVEKSFEKAVFGGYDMGPVDEFLETVAADYATLSKENAELKKKMKVLVAKIEEYRATDDAMRAALLSAQKLGKEITEEAEAKRETMLAETKAECEQMKNDTENEVALAQAQLSEAKNSTAKYIDSIRGLLQKQLEFFDNISEFRPEPIVTPAPAERSAIPAPAKAEAAPAETTMEDTVKAIENSVARHVDERPMQLEFDTAVVSSDSEPTKLFNFGDILGD